MLLRFKSLQKLYVYKFVGRGGGWKREDLALLNELKYIVYIIILRMVAGSSQAQEHG